MVTMKLVLKMGASTPVKTFVVRARLLLVLITVNFGGSGVGDFGPDRLSIFLPQNYLKVVC